MKGRSSRSARVPVNCELNAHHTQRGYVKRTPIRTQGWRAPFLDAHVTTIDIVLTDSGIQFADLPKNRSGPIARLRGTPSNARAGVTASTIG